MSDQRPGNPLGLGAAAAQPYRRPTLACRRSLAALAGLSSLTWLLPDRFAEGELTIEALHTALGLLSSFHDSIASSPPGAPPLPGGDLLLALSTLEQIQVGVAQECVLRCGIPAHISHAFKAFPTRRWWHGLQ